jgi:dethiobiotin synthetase
MPEGIVIAITGIDTDIGKTVATGLLARWLLAKGYSVITQKIAQTGCMEVSEDIVRHRQLMGIGLQEDDRQRLTCPYIFPEPCSPHLAAALVGETIDCEVITTATRQLRQRYQFVLLEGVGGLSVPLNDETTLLDYLQHQGYPLILVSGPRLGSINHTLAALELAQVRGLTVRGIIYNRFKETNGVIAEDSKKVFLSYLSRFGFDDCLIDLFAGEVYDDGSTPEFDDFFKDILDFSKA